MKFAFIADIHLSRYGQDSIHSESNLPERLHMLKNTLYQIANYCVENEINQIVIGGDILHGKSVIYAIAQKVMLRFFRKYKKDIEFTVIDGNHDVSGKGSDAVSALESLASEPNVCWIGMKDRKETIGNIFFVPHSKDMVDIIRNSQEDILISHFGLNEGKLNSGISIVSDIGLKDLRGKYKLVLLGHYHKPQEIIENEMSVYYVGSPIQLDWGEKEDEKRFLVVDTSDLSVKSIPTTGYSKHIELKITNENKKQIVEEAKKLQELGHKVNVIAETQLDMDGIDIKVIDKTEKDITNRGISIKMSERERLTRYMEINNIPEEKREVYLKTAIRLIGGKDEEGDSSPDRDGELWSISGSPGI